MRRMNNKGQTAMISIVVGILIFMAGMIFVNFIMPEIDTFRNVDNFDCSNSSSITDGMKLSCLAVGLVIPYFIVIVLSFAGGVIIDSFISS